MLMARTLTETNVDQPNAANRGAVSDSGKIEPKNPLVKLAWCANQDPDDTGESHEQEVWDLGVSRAELEQAYL